mmetsp:Transcript_55126/g.176665  ORF Transcript_55126/g.176665 Transcript_55126/m.176665 type:complete len:171 (-) Transcript_55126:337-849(-)
MLLVCGPVTRQHFLLAFGCLAAGAVLSASVVLEGVPSSMRLVGGLLFVVGLLQLLIFGFMLKQYGWRPVEGGTRTVYACQFCGTQFPTWEAAADHERLCPCGTGVAVPIGGAPTVLGMPMGSPVPMGHVVQAQPAVPTGQVVQAQPAVPMGQVVNNQPMGQGGGGAYRPG